MNDHLIKGDHADHASDIVVPVGHQRVADPHHQQRDVRQRLVRPQQFREDLLEVRHDEDHQADHGQQRDGQHHARIDHRRLHLARNTGRFFHETGQAVENDLHRTGSLTRPDHVQIELVKRPRMLRQRLRERRSALDRLRRFAEHDLHRRVFRLAFEGMQRTDQRQPGAEQNRQLARHHGQFLTLDHHRAERHIHAAPLLLAGAGGSPFFHGGHRRFQ